MNIYIYTYDLNKHNINTRMCIYIYICTISRKSKDNFTFEGTTPCHQQCKKLAKQLAEISSKAMNLYRVPPLVAVVDLVSKLFLECVINP